MGFHIDPSYLHLYTSGRTPNVHFLEGRWWLLSQKLLTLAQMIYRFYWAIFASGLKTDFQPASIQRPVLHLDPWVTYLSMHLLRIPGHVKGSKYHTLIDSESYFLPLRSLRILCGIWLSGEVSEQTARSYCVEDLVPPLRHQDPRE